MKKNKQNGIDSVNVSGSKVWFWLFNMRIQLNKNVKLFTQTILPVLPANEPTDKRQ